MSSFLHPRSTLLIILSILLLLTTSTLPVRAHSNLGYPLAYSKVACKGKRRWCQGACPPVWKGLARNSPRKPAAVWRRGQRVRIVWHKNNHIDGFYRRSLVPVKYMHSHEWHKRTAFEWGCWSQGTFKCGYNNPLCGGDQQGRAYRNSMVVPSVFPDGDYVFAQVWYGGLQWQRRYPKYSDYFSCSFVRIRGGAKSWKHAGKFNPGGKKIFKKDRPGMCKTGATRPLQCGGEACEHLPIIDSKPAEFRGNRKPPIIYASIFKGGTVLKHGRIQRVDRRRSKSRKMAIRDNKNDEKNDDRVAKAEARAARLKRQRVARWKRYQRNQKWKRQQQAGVQSRAKAWKQRQAAIRAKRANAKKIALRAQRWKERQAAIRAKRWKIQQALKTKKYEKVEAQKAKKWKEKQAHLRWQRVLAKRRWKKWKQGQANRAWRKKEADKKAWKQKQKHREWQKILARRRAWNKHHAATMAKAKAAAAAKKRKQDAARARWKLIQQRKLWKRQGALRWEKKEAAKRKRRQQKYLAAQRWKKKQAAMRWRKEEKYKAWKKKQAAMRWRKILAARRWRKAKKAQAARRRRQAAMRNRNRNRNRRRTLVKKKGKWKKSKKSKWKYVRPADCSMAKIPAKPRGSWGAKYSKRWWGQRDQMIRRRMYCNKCKFPCYVY